jgi:hypothetical protein
VNSILRFTLQKENKLIQVCLLGEDVGIGKYPQYLQVHEGHFTNLHCVDLRVNRGVDIPGVRGVGMEGDIQGR